MRWTPQRLTALDFGGGGGAKCKPKPGNLSPDTAKSDANGARAGVSHGHGKVTLHVGGCLADGTTSLVRGHAKRSRGEVTRRGHEERSRGEIVTRRGQEERGEITMKGHEERSRGEVTRRGHEERSPGEVTKRGREERSRGEVTRRGHEERSRGEVTRSAWHITYLAAHAPTRETQNRGGKPET